MLTKSRPSAAQNGERPLSGRNEPKLLIADVSGKLYGTTLYGGGHEDVGTIFQLTPPATVGGVWTEASRRNRSAFLPHSPRAKSKTPKQVIASEDSLGDVDPDPNDLKRAQLGKAQTIHESEMALFSESNGVVCSKTD